MRAKLDIAKEKALSHIFVVILVDWEKAFGEEN